MLARHFAGLVVPEYVASDRHLVNFVSTIDQPGLAGLSVHQLGWHVRGEPEYTVDVDCAIDDVVQNLGTRVFTIAISSRAPAGPTSSIRHAAQSVNRRPIHESSRISTVQRACRMPG